MKHFFPQDPFTRASFNERIDEVNAHMTHRANPHGVTLPQVGGCRPNFLDNWDFRSPVNQRGQTSYTAPTGYTADRWQNQHSTEVRVEMGYLQVINSANNYAGVRQRVDNPSRFAGKVLTLSADLRTVSGQPGQMRLIVNETLAQGGYVDVPSQRGIVSVTVTLPQTVTSIWVDIISPGVASTWDMYAIKLELGAVSTLAATPPVDYGEELRKCQRYAVELNILGVSGTRVAFGRENGETRFPLLAPLPVTMRGNPVLEKLAGNWVVWAGSRSVSVTGISVYAVSAGGVTLDAHMSQGAQPVYTAAELMSASADARLLLSADL